MSYATVWPNEVCGSGSAACPASSSATALRAKNTGHAAEQEREDVKAARLSWFERQLDLDPDRLVFLDETAPNTKMVRCYGRAPRGERCRVAVPFGHWKTITVTDGLRNSGLTVTALFDGPMTGVRSRGYVEETLIPALKPGDTVVLDNLPAHKVSGIRERIEVAGARLLYLPAYSPDFNPIELAFAKLKAIPRAEAARTISHLCDTIQRAFQRFTSTECRCYLAAAGSDAYDPHDRMPLKDLAIGVGQSRASAQF